MQIKKVTAIVIGAGSRGRTYSRYAIDNPDKFEIVGVADPRESARQHMMKKFNLNSERCYETWTDLCKEDKFSDCAIICTQDQQHVGPAVALAKKGYNILLEKPMAVTPEDCTLIYKTCTEAGVLLCVCHILRYHPCVIKIKEFIDSGKIGEVVNITDTEPIGFWHFAHSFVRGSWRNKSESTFSLLAKCCHDVDLIAYWMNFQKCTKISSFGSLMHFKKSNKPKGAGSRCMECPIENDCAYSAKKIYLDPKPTKPRFPMAAVCDIEDSEQTYLSHLTKAVQNGPYGLCAYDADNDVCDNQVVNFMFENGATANLNMIAYTKDVGERKVSVYGTKGELKWDDMLSHQIQHYDFLSQTNTTVQCESDEDIPKTWGHGGADYYTIRSFVDAIANNRKDDIKTGPKVSLYSHLLTFAAEKSRVTGEVVSLLDDPLFANLD